ncbi:zinc finger protein 383-like [Xenopus laevis]|uniref:Zinc finger protein 383-like n=1 Tax=Xenopus laevis TaxID=8355 RepID=A0A8J1LN73_XENLA|nr:zinc finger protein 383-like [Xenopus laevis]
MHSGSCSYNRNPLPDSDGYKNYTSQIHKDFYFHVLTRSSASQWQAFLLPPPPGLWEVAHMDEWEGDSAEDSDVKQLVVGDMEESAKPNDVTVCFSVEELDSLEDGQRDHNKNLKTKIHHSPNLVGYLYVKPETVPRIRRGEGLCVSSDLYSEKRRNRSCLTAGESVGRSEEWRRSPAARTGQSYPTAGHKSLFRNLEQQTGPLEDKEPSEREAVIGTDRITSAAEPDNPQGVVQQRNRRARKYWCGDCGDCFRERSHFLQHQETHSKQESTFTEHGQSLLSNRHQGVQTAADSSSYPECSVDSTDEPKPANHRRSPAEAKSYTCKDCGKNFTQNASLIVHQRTHTGERPHNCKVCGKSFISGSYLVMHQRVHTGERPYACNECGKRFISSSNLIIHQRVHTGEKPYLCTECGKCFGHSSHLVRHQKVHTGERPFTCAECGKAFSRSSHLVRHQIIHMRNPANQAV